MWGTVDSDGFQSSQETRYDGIRVVWELVYIRQGNKNDVQLIGACMTVNIPLCPVIYVMFFTNLILY